MPTKRIIITAKTPGPKVGFGYVLRADVPAANQPAYKDPSAVSAYKNCSAAELQDIRNGLVAERGGTILAAAGTPLATIQTSLEGYWTTFQNEVTAETVWGEYGRYWSNAPAWNASPGIPTLAGSVDEDLGIPTFFALTGVSAYAANKFQFTLYNGAGSTAAGLLLKIRLLVILSGVAAVTGAAPSVWSLRRRENPTTTPAGGTITVVSTDSAMALPAGISAHNAPTTSPAGGTTSTFVEFVPQADEQKLSTLDAPTALNVLNDFGGQIIYRAAFIPGCQPLTIRQGQTLEVQQSGTAGTGNCRVLCVFTVG